MVAEAHAATLERHKGILEAGQRPAEFLHGVARDLAAVARREDALAEALVEQLRLHLLLRLHVVDAFLAADTEQRRLGDIHMARGHQLIHLPVEEREQERANVRAVDVGVGHDHDLVVPPLAEVGLDSDSGADRGDHAPHFLVGEHLVFTALVGVDDLAPQRQDRLILPVAAALGRAAGRIALHEIEFAPLDVAARAVAKLTRQAAAREGTLPLTQERLRLLGRRPGLGREHSLERDRLGALGILLEVFREKVANRRIDDAFDFAVAEFCLRLPLELRMGHANADHDGEPLADVLARGHEILVQAALLAVGVERAGEGRTEARHVRAPLGRGDVVDVAVEVFGELAGVLQGDVP